MVGARIAGPEVQEADRACGQVTALRDPVGSTNDADGSRAHVFACAGRHVEPRLASADGAFVIAPHVPRTNASPTEIGASSQVAWSIPSECTVAALAAILLTEFAVRSMG